MAGLLGIGADLAGVSPPFTPSGKAAILRSRVGAGDYDFYVAQPNLGGHRGLLLHWRADRRRVEELLPWPLEPVPETDRIYAYVNKSQRLNVHRAPGSSGNASLRRLNPHLANDYQLNVFIFCRYGEIRGQYIWVMYKDVDTMGPALGHPNGWHTKLATFQVSYPIQGQPLNRVMQPGAVAQVAMSRFGERILKATFEAKREIDPREMAILGGHRPPMFGIRYFPDYVDRRGPPLVHDLISRQPSTPEGDVRPARYTHAWAGDAEVVLGGSDHDELDLLRPLEMLESYFVYLETYSGMRTRAGASMTNVLHDYLAETPEQPGTSPPRGGTAGTTTPTPRDLMRFPPPFTLSGKASFARPHLSEEDRSQVVTGRWGMLLRWRADRRSAEVLLPKPLEPVPHSDRISLFLNETQLASRTKAIEREHPRLTNWHDASFLIPCAYRGVAGLFSWVSYKDADLDYQVILGAYRGIATKLASFTKTFPEPSQALNREMQPGGVARMLVSRWDESMIAGTFMAARELKEDEIARHVDLAEFSSVFALRHMPDFFTPGPPLVQDLVRWTQGRASIARAWIGEGEVVLGDSDNEELNLLRPLEMLDCYFIHLEQQGERGSVVHDYLSAAAPDRAELSRR